jgi:hypothetical protein
MRVKLTYLMLGGLVLAVAGCSSANNNKEAKFVNLPGAQSSLSLVAGIPYHSALDRSSTVSFIRNDGKPGKAHLYSPAQIIREGSHLIFSEYLPSTPPVVNKTRSENANILYPLGGSIRLFDPNKSVSTIFHSKKLDGSKRPVRGLSLIGQDILFSRGSAIWRLDRNSGKVSALAGSLDQKGNRDGAGSAARFSFLISFARQGNNLYIADRDNMAVRRLDLATGQVSTPIELAYPPQGLAIVGQKLWISGKNLSSVNLDCSANCPVKDYKLWPQATVASYAIASDNKGSLITTSPQGVFRYNTETATSERIVNPGETSERQPDGLLTADLLSSSGAAVLGNHLYYVSGRHIGSILLPR